MAQNEAKPQQLPPTPFRIGERLSYNVSFEKFNNIAYAEIYAVSRGKIGDKDAVELRSRIKTLDFVSAAFYLLDETRTTFASAETGLPLYVSKTASASAMPKETISNYLVSPTTSYDLLTLIYKIRNSGGIGSVSMQENDKIYNVTFQTAAIEKVKTDAGEFETSVSTVQSEYLTEIGIKDMKISFSTDEHKIPVLIRFKTDKGEFKAAIASIQIVEPEATTQPTPSPVQTPRPTSTPKPPPTPTPYVENQPLAAELSFALGETLEYKISANSQPAGSFTLQAKERKQFLGEDSLLLTATVTGVEQGNQAFSVNDVIKAQVNPETLAPQQIEIKFAGSLSNFNQIAQFDQKTGFITVNGANRTEAPVGTHSILSLIYAVRSFNLKPSKDPSNPVNDTRVAVFWDTQPYVFTLRPSSAELITLQGEKVSAQLISINTGNAQLDLLNIKLWLSNDEKRVPLRFSFGSYQADLISQTNIPPK